MRSGCGPRRRRAVNSGRRHGNVLRRTKALRGTVTREVRAVVVGGILLLERREVTKVRLHSGDVGLVLGVREFRNRNRGENTDDYDNDQKLNKSKTLFITQHFITASTNIWVSTNCLVDDQFRGAATRISRRRRM